MTELSSKAYSCPNVLAYNKKASTKIIAPNPKCNLLIGGVLPFFLTVVPFFFSPELTTEKQLVCQRSVVYPGDTESAFLLLMFNEGV